MAAQRVHERLSIVRSRIEEGEWLSAYRATIALQSDLNRALAAQRWDEAREN